MTNEIPNITFKKDENLGVEVLNFDLLFKRLQATPDHDPFAVHKIEFYLILIVTKGSYSHFLDFKHYTLQKGSTLFVAKNQIQSFSKEIAKAEGYCIVFNSEFLDRHYFLAHKPKFNRLFNYHIESPIIHQNELGDNQFLDIAEKLHLEYTSSHLFGKSEILGSLLNVMLLKAERAKEFRSGMHVGSRWMELFGQFRLLLEQEYTTNRSSRAYAGQMLISYKLLNDIVKKLSGKSAKSFIDSFVTTEIKRYLVTTPLSIKEISYKTGFDEPANMVKFFKKNTGFTPLKFRNR